MGNYPFVTPRAVALAEAPDATREREPLRFETIVSEGAFAQLRDQWDPLVRAAPRPSPFLLHCWLLEWWRHYGEGCRLAVEAAFRGATLVGALPLLTYRNRGLRISTFVGARQSGLADALIARDQDFALVEALVDRVSASDHDYVDFFGVAANSRLATLSGPRRLRLFYRVAAPVLDLAEGWEAAYHRKTNSHRRRHHKHRRRQLAALGTVEVSCARTFSELAPALEEAVRIHELRWRDRPDGSGFVTETGKRFNRAVLKELAEMDATRIAMLRIDGRPIAFCWYFLLEQRAFIHRLAFDPAFKRYSPGIVNALDSLELAAEEGATLVEFLGGAERYKVELSDRFEPLYLALGLPGSALGRAAVTTRAAWLGARDLAKRSELAQRIYRETEPARRLVARRRDVLRPSGLRRTGD